MRRSTLLALLVAAVSGGAACGGTVTGVAATSSGTGGTGASTTSSAGGTGGAGGTTTSSTGGMGGGLAVGQCHGQGDCKSGFDECLAPGGFAGCGICQNPPATCVSDAECKSGGATLICAPVECACSGQRICEQGCTSDGMCGAGETCAASNHCQPKACGSAGDCPANFACTASACQRKACASDSMCQGYCVNGACYDTLGACVPIPA